MTASPARLRREAGRFAKFSVVGAVGAVVDFGGFNLLHAAAGIAPLLASTLSFLLAVTSNFVWNRWWTYPDSRAKPIGRQAGQFALVSLVGLAIRTPVFAVAQRPAIDLMERTLPALGTGLPFGPIPVEVVGRNLALALAVGIVLVWNFAANRLWTYSDAG